MDGPARFHSGQKFFARKQRRCSTWWHSRCVIRGDGQDRLSVPCVMFERCMYAAQREDYTPEQLEVLEAWSHAHVCLTGFSPTADLDDSTPRAWETL